MIIVIGNRVSSSYQQEESNDDSYWSMLASPGYGAALRSYRAVNSVAHNERYGHTPIVTTRTNEVRKDEIKT